MSNSYISSLVDKVLVHPQHIPEFIHSSKEHLLSFCYEASIKPGIGVHILKISKSGSPKFRRQTSRACDKCYNSSSSNNNSNNRDS